MKTAAPLQLTNLIKSFVIFFVVSSIASFAATYVILQDIRICWPGLLGNLVIAGLVGWWWYKGQYHAVFSYDQQGFELQKGRGKKSSKKWQDLSQVSLVHEGYGRFLVRVYETGGGYLDIPASDLKLSPSDLRFEALDLVKGGSPADRVDEPR